MKKKQGPKYRVTAKDRSGKTVTVMHHNGKYQATKAAVEALKKYPVVYLEERIDMEGDEYKVIATLL